MDSDLFNNTVTDKYAKKTPAVALPSLISCAAVPTFCF